MNSMKMTPFHTTVMLAREEARATGSRKIEAEHLLLALSRQKGTDARDLLESAGLDHAAILDAMEKEFEQSLAVAGVTLKGKNLTSSGGVSGSDPRPAQSFKLALGRAAALVSKRIAPPLEPTHVLVGVLEAREGTVPRILDVAGVDGAELCERARGALPSPGDTRRA
jgi:ATP-dependent Clp protease ATP-binding subunit ClpA